MTASPGPVWVVCWRYPVLSETIVPTEVAELVRQGVDVVLVPLEGLEGTSETFGIPAHRILRPSPWPGTRRAQLSMLGSAGRKHPGGVVTFLMRLVDFNGDDARGALVTVTQLLHAAESVRRPSHVHAHFAGHLAHVAALLASVLGCSWSATAHAKDIYLKPERLTADFRDAAFVRTISRHGQTWVLENAGLRVGDRVPLIHCGVDTELLAPKPTSLPSERPWRLVSVGRLVPKKGHDLLVDATARLRAEGAPIECDIIGEGPEKESLLRHIAERGLQGHVRLRTGVGRAEMLALVGQADVAVLASRTTDDGDREGIPLALMEAMALGKPVVAGDVGGVRELVDGAGILFDGRTAEGLASAIRQVVQLPATEFLDLATRCRRRVEDEFSLRRNVGELADRLRAALTPDRKR